jgi:uncharacterized protein
MRFFSQLPEFLKPSFAKQRTSIMSKLIRWSQSHPLAVIVIIVVCSIIASLKLENIRIDTSAEGMMMKNDPARDYYNDTLEKFGSDTITIIYVKDNNIFTPEKLEKLEELVYAIEDTEGVRKVDSLFSVTNFQSNDGFLENNPLMDWVPETIEEAEEVRQNALRNYILKGNLIAKDGKSIALNVSLEPKMGDPEFIVNMGKKIEALLAPYQNEFSTIFQIGSPYVRKTTAEVILADQKTLVPLSVAILLLMLVIIMRSPSGAILPIFTAGTSVLWTFGFMAYVGIPINALTFIVPSLIIVIGSTEDIHILSEYMEGMHEHGGVKQQAINYMAEKVGTAVFLTGLTTFLGFLSISTNQITMLKQFGMAAAFGLFVNPIITSLIAPVYLRYLGPKEKKKKESDAMDRFFESLANIILNILHSNPKGVLAVLLGIAAVVGVFGFNVVVNNDMMGFFKKDAPIIQRVQTLHEDLAGAKTFFIRISSGLKNTFKKPENLAQLDRVQDYLQKQGSFDKTISLADYIRLINREMNGGDDKFFAIPESSALISQYLLFLHRGEIESYVTPGFDEVNILVRHNVNSSYELKNVLDKVEKGVRQIINPHFKVVFTGENLLINKAADSIASGQVKGIILLLLVIFVIMSILFVNVKAGLLSLIPNIFPVALNFGIMAIFDIPLNTGTCMVAVIAIGIAVDDTVHFMTRYQKEMSCLQNQMQSMDACVRTEIRPVLTTSFALILGFLVVAFSQFVPLLYFGVLAALVMLFAFIGDMFITPILLSSTQLITIWDIVGLDLQEEVLTKSKIFEGFKPWQIRKIILLGRMEERSSGELLITEGQMGDSMFLVLKGQAKVYKTDERIGKDIVFATFGPGEIFGEIALIEQCTRSANVGAAEPIQFIEIDWDGLKRIQKIYPRLASQLFLNLSRILGQRLVQTDKLLTEKE